MGQSSKFVGLDLNKKTIAVAIADDRDSEVHFCGEIPKPVDSLHRLGMNLPEDGAEGVSVRPPLPVPLARSDVA